MTKTTRWVICVICAVLGVIGLVYALIYLTVPIHSLPGFVPGKKEFVNGHYHKRAALAGLIGVVLIVVAFVIALAGRKAAPSGDDASGAAVPGGGAGDAVAPAPSAESAPEVPAPGAAATGEGVAAGGDGGGA